MMLLMQEPARAVAGSGLGSASLGRPVMLSALRSLPESSSEPSVTSPGSEQPSCRRLLTELGDDASVNQGSLAQLASRAAPRGAELKVRQHAEAGGHEACTGPPFASQAHLHGQVLCQDLTPEEISPVPVRACCSSWHALLQGCSVCSAGCRYAAPTPVRRHMW